MDARVKPAEEEWVNEWEADERPEPELVRAASFRT